MKNSVIELFKERPLVIPRVIINNYKKMGINEEELLIIAVIMAYGDKVVYDPEMFARELGFGKHDIMRIINKLFDKNILSLVIEKDNRKQIEYISLELFYDKLFNIIIGKEEDKEIDNSIFSIFEAELGRTMTPMEYAKIKEWTNEFNQELIVCALNEAVLNHVNSFNYIDSILVSWKKKGYQNKLDIQKEKYRTKKEKVEVFDTDWLNEQ